MANDQLDELDYYALLGLEPTADSDAVRAAWRKFALKFHPDRHVEGGDEKIARATKIYRRGSEAFEALLDPLKRKAYDVVLARGELRLTTDAQALTRSAAARANAPKSVRADSGRAGARRSATGVSRTRKSASPGARAKPMATEIQSPTARAFYARALQASKAGDYSTALRMIESAIAQEPGHPLLLEARRRLAPFSIG